MSKWNSTAWNRLYAEWKRAHSETTPKERGKVVRGCLRKLGHEDFLAAMRQANALEPFTEKKLRLSIYKCDICGLNHVGNTSVYIRYRFHWKQPPAQQ